MSGKKILSYLAKSALVLLFVFLLAGGHKVAAASLTSASDTLQCPAGWTGTTCGGSRLSYRASAAANSSGTSLVTIDTGDADQNTNHLFPGDGVCFSGPSLNGCQAQTPPSTYKVVGVPSTTTFNLANPLAGSLNTNDFVIASESAQHLISFVTTNVVPIGGTILVTIPAIQTSGKTNDGMPDTAAAVASNGFDLNSVAAGNVSITGCTGANWGAATVTAATGANNHTISFTRATSTCTAGTTIVITIGDTTARMINPAPLNTGHTQGVSEIYTISVATRDGSANTIDSASIKVAPIESVFVSATIDTTLSFSIAGIASAQTKCGVSTSVTTTATSVPGGTIATANSFLNAAQLISLSTNAASGYAVKVEENDQMGKDGIVCTGNTAGESVSCIKDTTCNGGTCDESTSAEWTTATSNGLGFSLENITNTDASFLYNESSRTFSARQFADQEAPETKQSIMSAAGPKNNSQVDVCYRITISGTQPAGYYYNVVKYTATAVF